MLQKIDKDRLDKVLNIIQTWDTKFPQAKIVRELGFSKGQVSSYLNAKEAMSENFFQTFISKYDDIIVTQTEEDFFGLNTATLLAVKAALKVITRKLIEEDVRRTKRDIKIVSQEFDKAMKEQYNQLLHGLHKK